MAEQAHLTPEDIIARIDDWKGKDVRYEELGGGITNHNYIVWVDGGPEKGGKKYVMRVPGIGTDMFIDRDVERDCMIQAAKVGVGPAVAYQIDPEGALVIDFVEGEIMHPETMAGHPERLKQVGRDGQGVPRQGASSRTRSSSSTCSASTRRSPRDIDAPMPERARRRCWWPWRTSRRRCSGTPVPAVACHNDLLSRELHHRRRRQDVDHRLGVRRHDRPVLRPRRLRHGAPVHARRGAPHHRDLLRRDGRAATSAA